MKLLGPFGLDHLDGLTITVADDYFRRADFAEAFGLPGRRSSNRYGAFIASGQGLSPTKQGGQNGTRHRLEHQLPVGEELPFVMEPTLPPPWSQQTDAEWQRQQGTIVKLRLLATHATYGQWTLPCGIDFGLDVLTSVFVPEVGG